MKQTLLILLIFTSVFSSTAQQRPWMQATIKPGSTPRTVDVYLKTSTSFTQKDEAMTVVLAIPSTVTPPPSVASPTGFGSAGVTSNGLGPVAGISGLQPTFLVNNLGSGSREVVISMQTINNVSYYLYTFIFANTGTIEHDWVAGVEQRIFSIQFNGCTNNCNPGSILMANLPNGGGSGGDYFYFQPNLLGDVTNAAAPFYQNPFSTAPVNGGGYQFLSTVGLATPISLPIKLTAFDTRTNDCNIRINWTVAEENGSAFYDVESSRDGIDFARITRINAVSDNGLRSYVYEDKLAEAGKTFYRLRLVEKSGSFTYSSIKEINSNCSGTNNISVFPTITRGPVKIILAPNSENAIIRVYNSTGHQVLVDNTRSGTRTINLSSLASGTYLINVFDKEKVLTTKIVKQ